MTVTDYPNGASSFGTVTQYGVSTISGAGTVTTTLDTVTSVVASLATVPGTAAGSVIAVHGTAHANVAGAATFILRTTRSDGAAGTVAAPVAWCAVGTKD